MDVMEGVVVFLSFSEGSKSESVRPFLYMSKNKLTRLWMKGDNPFENNRINEFDGKHVIIKGEKKGDVFEISDICEAMREGEKNG